MTQVDWKLVVKGLKTSADPDKRALIERMVREVAGEEVPIRTARKGLLLIAVDALRGRPRLVAVHGEGVVLILRLADFLDVVSEPGPSLGEVMDGVGRHRSKLGRTSGGDGGKAA